MKHCLLLMLMLGLAGHSFCQTTDSISQLRQSYLIKSRHESTAGIILLSSGIVLTAYGVGSAIGDAVGTIATGDHPRHPNAAGTIATVGLLSFFTSFPLFIIAGHNKGKAKHLSLGMQPAQSLLPAGKINVAFQPAITWHISLAKRK